MTAPSHRIGRPAERPPGRGGVRRLSRRFAAVGVHISAARLAEIAAGHPATESESVDISFAEAALRIRREQRRTAGVRLRKRCVHCAVVAGAMALALAALWCLGLGFFLMAGHPPPR